MVSYRGEQSPGTGTHGQKIGLTGHRGPLLEQQLSRASQPFDYYQGRIHGESASLFNLVLLIFTSAAIQVPERRP